MVTSRNSFAARADMALGGRSYEIFRLDAVEGSARLPYSLKILLENMLRNEDGVSVREEDIAALAGWDSQAEPATEMSFAPARILMQDFTGVPAVVDLAAMRDAMVALGGDPGKVNPADPGRAGHRPLDHRRLLRGPDAFARNAELEFERNEERYRFLRWGQGGLRDPPGDPAQHRHLPPGQPRVPRQGGVHESATDRPTRTRCSAPTPIPR